MLIYPHYLCAKLLCILTKYAKKLRCFEEKSPSIVNFFKRNLTDHIRVCAVLLSDYEAFVKFYLIFSFCKL